MASTAATTPSSRDQRLDQARDALRRATRTAEERGQRRTGTPLPSADLLPVAAAFGSVLPGLRRGTTIAVPGSTALLLSLLAAASTRGSWCALIGMAELGLVAAAEAGVNLDRVALVPNPGEELVAVTAALIEGMDIIAIAGTGRLRAGDRQRLSARAHQHGTVLLPTGGWVGADLELRLDPGAGGGWRGVSNDGHGRLRAREIQLRVGGRGAAQHARKARLLLPRPTGAVSALERTTQPCAEVRRSARAG